MENPSTAFSTKAIYKSRHRTSPAPRKSASDSLLEVPYVVQSFEMYRGVNFSSSQRVSMSPFKVQSAHIVWAPTVFTVPRGEHGMGRKNKEKTLCLQEIYNPNKLVISTPVVFCGPLSLENNPPLCVTLLFPGLFSFECLILASHDPICLGRLGVGVGVGGEAWGRSLPNRSVDVEAKLAGLDHASCMILSKLLPLCVSVSSSVGWGQ